MALLPGALTPSLQEDLVRLGVWMPFGRAAQELAHFRRTVVSRPTAERLTEAAGAAYVAVQTAEVERLLREAPPAPVGPAKLLVSVDGAMVPLLGGEWAEVKTLVIGEVQPPLLVKGEAVIRTQQLSYFSRLTDADTFQRLALVETHRRGVEHAVAVAAVTDGSEWLQKFLDYHCYRVVRILDFPHAGEHINAVGQGQWGVGSHEAHDWLTEQLQQLKQRGPEPVLAEVRRLVTQPTEPPDWASNLAYLEKRVAQMQYPAFRAAGWPIGDGVVESANKLLVEARLKGSGMHWARPHVDPLLALRTIVCSDRWDEAWPQIVTTLRQQAQQRRSARHQQRRTATRVQTAPPPAPAITHPTPEAPGTPTQLIASAVTPGEPRRPPANHPWRHMPVGRARFRPPPKPPSAKP